MLFRNYVSNYLNNKSVENCFNYLNNIIMFHKNDY